MKHATNHCNLYSIRITAWIRGQKVCEIHILGFTHNIINNMHYGLQIHSSYGLKQGF